MPTGTTPVGPKHDQYKRWFESWRHFFRTSPDQSSGAIEMLRRWYIEVTQQAALFKHQAEKMHYPQFKKSLLHIWVGKNKRSKWIAEKILLLGGKLPEVAEQRSVDENSWRSLLLVLEEENRSAEHLPEQIWSLESAHPDITQFLQQSYEEEEKYRTEIKENADAKRCLCTIPGLVRPLAPRRSFSETA